MMTSYTAADFGYTFLTNSEDDNDAIIDPTVNNNNNNRGDIDIDIQDVGFSNLSPISIEPEGEDAEGQGNKDIVGVGTSGDIVAFSESAASSSVGEKSKGKGQGPGKSTEVRVRVELPSIASGGLNGTGRLNRNNEGAGTGRSKVNPDLFSKSLKESKYLFAPEELEFDYMKVDKTKSMLRRAGGMENPQFSSSVCCCCFCFLLFVLAIIPGAALVKISSDPLVQSSNEDVNKKNHLIGVILEYCAIAFLLLSTCHCCLGCIFACGGSPTSSNKNRYSGFFGAGDENDDEYEFEFVRLNDKYEDLKDNIDDVRLNIIENLSMKEAAVVKDAGKRELKKLEKQRKQEIKAFVSNELQMNITPAMVNRQLRRTVFVIDFEGDIQVSSMNLLREEITAILKVAIKDVDAVVVRVSSPGGSVVMYGLAASQLIRLKNAGIELIVCVDSVAASGGYMMASVANKIIASPFAMVGSIGVISIVPNIDKLLKKNNVDTHVFTAGKYKNTVNVVGPVTSEGKQHFQQELENIHEAFKSHIVLNRPILKETIDKVSTGEAFLAVDGKHLGLVDEIKTSDELISDLCRSCEVLVIKHKQKGLPKWLSDMALLKNGYANLIRSLFSNAGAVSGAERYF